eukprot:3275083-Amphidinium_carterae.1
MGDCKNVVLAGDYNSWLGVQAGDTVGSFNLTKRNNRGIDMIHFLAARGMKVTTTILPHAILETRVGGDGTKSAIDYITTTSAIHRQVQ